MLTSFEDMVFKIFNMQDIEQDIRKFWKDHRIQQQVIEHSIVHKNNGGICFYEGPPFATGEPHYGHAVGFVLKDLFARYCLFRFGKFVYVQPGWDCHGVPIEYEIQKKYNLSTHRDILSFGIAEFCNECKDIVLRCDGQWKDVADKLCRWMDVSNTYMTMSKEYMDIVWQVFGILWNKKLVYWDKRIMPYSYQLGTVLSNFEATSSYKMLKEPAVFVMFKIIQSTETLSGCFLVIWTTTPWTLFANVLIGIHSAMTYVLIQDPKGNHVIVSSTAYNSQSFCKEWHLIRYISGKDLIGTQYIPLWEINNYDTTRYYTVVDAEFVQEDSGTGLVHIAPGFGEDDYRLCSQHNINPILHVNVEGRFNDTVPLQWQGMLFVDADDLIIQYLKEQEVLLHKEIIEHKYPFCPRTDSKLMYKLSDCWSLKVKEFKERLLSANTGINWIPTWLKDGRFGNWLSNVEDWCISRSRYWGTPIPVWRSSMGEYLVIHSIKELEHLTGQKQTNIHRNIVDDIRIIIDGVEFEHVPFVFDCWFESGVMPYIGESSQSVVDGLSYPQHFPADFIIEGIDQTRGWFYTLLVLGVMLFGKSPFKNVIANGIVLAQDGQKMSKRLKNYPSLKLVLDQYGGDALRWYLLRSPVCIGEDLKFSEKDVGDIIRIHFMPLWNALHGVYVKYANEKNVFKSGVKDITNENCIHILDRWISVKLNELRKMYIESLDKYIVPGAMLEVEHFIEDLCNWYIRISKTRFLGTKYQSLNILYEVLLETSYLLAPIVPILSEGIYQVLRTDDMPVSVHVIGAPQSVVERHILDSVDAKLIEEMIFIREVVSVGHSVRKQYNIRVRQPLKQICVYSEYISSMSQEHLCAYGEIIQQELNVLKVKFSSKLCNTKKMIAKPNFKSAGPKLGPKVKLLKEQLDQLSQLELHKLHDGGSLRVLIQGDIHTICASDVVLYIDEDKWYLSDKRSYIELDIQMDEQLLSLGYIRDTKRCIMRIRRDLHLKCDDIIVISIVCLDEMESRAKNVIKCAASESGVGDIKYISDYQGDLEDKLYDDRASGCVELWNNKIYIVFQGKV